VWVAALGAVAILAIAGGAAAFFLLRGSGEQLLGRIPQGTDVVVTVYLDPSASQKVNLLRMVDDLPALGSRVELSDRIDGVIDGALSGTGLDHRDLNWVGAQVAIVVDAPPEGSGPTGVGLLVATDDEDAATASLDHLRAETPTGTWSSHEFEGTDVWSHTQGSSLDNAYALVDGVVVIGTTTDIVDGVITTTNGEGTPIEESADFQTTVQGLPEGRLGLAYVDPTDLLTTIQHLPGFDTATIGAGIGDIEAYRGFAISVSAESDGLALDAQVSYDPSKMTGEMRDSLSAPASENPLLADVPQDSLVVVQQTGLDAGLADAVDQLRTSNPELGHQLDRMGITGSGLLDSLTGDLAVGGRPSDQVGATGSILIGTDDEAAMAKALRRLGDRLRPLAAAVPSIEPSKGVSVGLVPPAKWTQEDYQGVTVRTLSGASTLSPFQLSYAVIDGAGVIGLTPDAVRAVVDSQQGGPSILDSTAYRDAMERVPSGQGSFYVDIDGIGDAVRNTLPPDAVEGYDRDVAPTLEHLDAFVLGAESSVERTHVRMFLRVP
jgi:Protein of unknown function (DUF3352)